MGLMDDLITDTAPARRTKMDEIMETLSPEDYQDFLNALETPTITQAAIRRALSKRGVHIACGTISQMRRDYLRKEVNK